MKPKFILFIVAIGGIFFVGCKKEIVNSPTLVGKWYEQKIVTQVYQGTTKISDTTVTSFTKLDFAQFNDNGTGNASASDTTIEFYKNAFNFTISGANLNIIQYGVDGNTTITTPYTISELTLNSLILHTVGAYLAPNNLTYTQTQDFYFTK